jgi:hypothetical protein
MFLAAAESIAGQRGLPSNLIAPPDPERIANAKGWLRGRMPPNRKYSQTSDQPALTAVFDLDIARSRADSFDKCCREIEGLLRKLIALTPPDPPAAGPAVRPP